MKISIITPCYNSEKYITDTFNSIVYQKKKIKLQYLIIDGGSNDSTLKVLEKNISSFLNRNRNNSIEFDIISEPDNGMYDALLKGFKKIDGDIVSYLNSDDMYLPFSLSTVVEIFKRHEKINWITGRATSYNSRGQNYNTAETIPYLTPFIRTGMYGTELPFIQQESTFWRKKVIDGIDLEKINSFKYAGDAYLWYEFSKYNTLFSVNSILGGFRHHDTQLSNALKKYYHEFFKIYEKPNRREKRYLWYFKHLLYNSSQHNEKKIRTYKRIEYRDNQWLVHPYELNRENRILIDNIEKYSKNLKYN